MSLDGLAQDAGVALLSEIGARRPSSRPAAVGARHQHGAAGQGRDDR
ncbi:MAG: hypothetical protein M3N31_01750 [Actinomycetota bacterium]|nr:hypothetical protein [Actinomycetota bacterium]